MVSSRIHRPNSFIGTQRMTRRVLVESSPASSADYSDTNGSKIRPSHPHRSLPANPHSANSNQRHTNPRPRTASEHQRIANDPHRSANGCQISTNARHRTTNPSQRTASGSHFPTNDRHQNLNGRQRTAKVCHCGTKNPPFSPKPALEPLQSHNRGIPAPSLKPQGRAWPQCQTTPTQSFNRHTASHQSSIQHSTL